MEKHNVYSISLPQRLAHRARVIAAMEGKSRSQLIRELLENLIANYDYQVYPSEPSTKIQGVTDDTTVDQI